MHICSVCVVHHECSVKVRACAPLSHLRLHLIKELDCHTMKERIVLPREYTNIP